MGDARGRGPMGKRWMALAAGVVVLQACGAGFLAAQEEEEKIGGWGGAALRVQMNDASDKLLNGRVGPALVQTVAGRRFVPWDRSAVRVSVLRTRIALGGVIKSWNTDSLAALLTLSEKTSYAGTNPYVRLTKDGGRASYEARLAEKLQNAAGKLEPHQVMALALDVCRDDYPLATLTAHNLLKEVAYAERGKTECVVGVAKGQKGDVFTTIYPERISRKLIDLRPEGDAVFYDRTGPWYHAFGLFFVGSVASGTDAQVFGEIENLTRVFKLGSAPDYFKERVNTWAGNLAPKLNDQVSRNVSADLPGNGTSPAPAAPARSPRPAEGVGGYWRFAGERFVKGTPDPNESMEASGGGGALQAVLTAKNFRSSASLTWSASKDLEILRPGDRISFTGKLTHSGDGAAIAGVALQPYGQPPGTGHVSGTVIMAGFDGTAKRTTTRQGDLTVPEGPLYPDERMELRIEIRPASATR